jgi:competence protein ComFB
MMAFIDSYHFEHLVNAGEQFLLEELGRQLEAYDGTICLCNECVVDMAAVALNSVKPLYQVTLLGRAYAAEMMNDGDYAQSIRTAVSAAIEKVRTNPAHDI